MRAIYKFERKVNNNTIKVEDEEAPMKKVTRQTNMVTSFAAKLKAEKGK